MWSQDIHGLNNFEDLNIREERLPIVKTLEAAMVSAKPKNNLYFIKKWAQKQMNELESDDDEYIEEDSKLGERKRNKETKKSKRRNAIVMAEVEDGEQSRMFSNKEEVPRNEERKSRIMLTLKQIPFLATLGWEEINQIVESAQIRQFSHNEKFASKGQLINKLYILLQGQLTRITEDKKESIIDEGSCMFEETAVSISRSNCNYYISSDGAWICGISAFKIHQVTQLVSQKKQSFYEKILMGVNLFHSLDKEQFYKLICMVTLLPVKKANEVIVEFDSPVDALYLVLRGQFLSCKHSLSNQITSFQSFKEGHVFGENWITRPTQAEYSIISKTEGVLGVIHRKQVERSIQSIEKLLQRKKSKDLR